MGTMGLALAALGSTTALTLVQTWLISKSLTRSFACFGMTILTVAAGLAVMAWLQ